MFATPCTGSTSIPYISPLATRIETVVLRDLSGGRLCSEMRMCIASEAKVREDGRR
jgi:hypothetical protein